MTQLQIAITAEILQATKNCGIGIDNCAIQEAIKGIFPNAIVDYKYIIPFPKDGISDAKYYWHTEKITLPQSATDFIEIFDDATPEERLQMPPFTFSISIPEALIDRINIDEVTEMLNNHPTLKLV